MAEFFNTPLLGMYFQYIVFFMVLWCIIQCARGVVFDNQIVAIDQLLGLLVAAVIILLMGMRPVDMAYGDTVNYAGGFRRIAENKNISLHLSKEWLNDLITYYCARYGNIHIYFTIFAILYVGPLWLAMRRIFKEYNFLPFIVVISMFTFWMYGVNGIRNGVGASLFILAMTYTKNIPLMVMIALFGAGMHNSVYIMIAAALLAWFWNDSREYLAVWLICIIVSYFYGNFIQTWMAGFADSVAADNKLTSYLNYNEQSMRSEGMFVSMTFRWDFLAYSALGVAIGTYFLIFRYFKDQYYQWIFNIYLICNSFWVLIIRAPYSNRFAQISWFILPVVLVYPFIRERFWVNQERMVAVGLLIFYAFGFITNMLPILLDLF